MLRFGVLCLFVASLVCVSSGCQQTCQSDEDCSSRQLCTNGTCLPRAACQTDIQCDIGLFCDTRDELCKRGCTNDERCPNGQTCFGQKCKQPLCGPKANPPTPMQKSCYTGKPSEIGAGITDGQCKEGKSLCINNGHAWSLCYDEVLSAKEICDTVDNDCNGKVDELPECQKACTVGLFRACQTSPAATRLTEGSRCAGGLQYCIPSKEDQSKGRWGPCLKERLPGIQQVMADQCLVQNTSCSEGKSDEIIAAICPCDPTQAKERACFLGDPKWVGKGPCRQGKQSCEQYCRGAEGPDGKCPADAIAYRWSSCQGSVLPIPEEGEECDGIDNDCDGRVDNRSDDPTKPLRSLCYPAGVAGCEVTSGGNCLGHCKGNCACGFSVCKDKVQGECLQAVTPKEEICNKQDDDCDGDIDEGLPNCK